MEARHHLQLTSSTQNPAMILKPTTNPSLLFSFRSHLRLLPFSTTSRLAAVKTATTTKPSTAAAEQLKHDWLASLSNDAANAVVSDSTWIIGVDPDVSGAVAVLKPSTSAVYDSPHLKVLVGKTIRRRLDAKSIVELLTGLDAPIGSVAYVEQSTPFPQDGKQGWWSGGFGYGLWIGVLVGLGFNVVPVASGTWKKKFELTGRTAGTKDESRRVASVLFPELSCELKRKKDHGRAEALLIAAYGKGMTLKPVEIAVNGN